jgi:DNA primase
LISRETIQQIQSRIDIYEIVSEFVKLKKRGANYLGLCPFHNEKTPSFIVSPTKEIFKCFGCGKSGNAITFLMEHEKYSYTEALRWLAARYNVEIEETDVSPEIKQKQLTADSLYILNQFAADFFSRQLHETETGQAMAYSYLEERGFTDATIRKFQLGYAPDARDAFTQTAIQAQYNKELLVKSGLVAKRDNDYYDNYRGRIIFPIHNQSGKIIGFGARVIGAPGKAPKYINTPENELYVKSRILYGMYFARQAIDKNDECLLVEGYTDVISLHQAGIENVVASGGTSLTTDQLLLIKKYTSNLTIIYDGDKAGIKAALRGVDLALEAGLHVKMVLIPDGEDPDSYVKQIGQKAFQDFIQREKKDFILFQIELQLDEVKNDPVKKAALVNQVADTLSKINKAEDFTLQQDYIRKSAGILQIEEEGLQTLVNKILRDRLQKLAAKEGGSRVPEPETSPQTPLDPDITALTEKDEQQEKGLVKCLIEYGLYPWDGDQTVADYIFSELNEQELITLPLLNKLIQMYGEWYREGLGPTHKSFLYVEDAQIRDLVIELMNFPYELSPNWEERFEVKMPPKEESYREDVASTLNYLKLKKIRKLIAENQHDLEHAKTQEELSILIQTHATLKQMEKALLEKKGTVIFK